ncbi:MAG: mandelate racemase/muconate lactonizing enzyme family protein [Candidatus Marinimicrobia bacterium]|nr:mandelate racemase/muconate lactonizing enzyme family protein [Candidatus Neomarinimicrobiota bacterium]
MKITNVECMVLDSKKNYITPKGIEEPTGVRYTCLIKVETDEGITGWSDIETQPHIAHIMNNLPPSKSGANGFEGLKELVLGEDPFEIERLWDKIYRGTIYYGRRGVAIQVLSGFDIACWDIMGKAVGKPIYKLLGAGYRKKVRAYASSVKRGTPEGMRLICKKYKKEGFTAVKFGFMGGGKELNVELVKAAREALGNDIDLLVDLGWIDYYRLPFDAIQLCKKIEPYNVFFIEDFLHPEDYDGYARVSKNVNIRIAAGEQEATPWGFKQLIERGKIDIVQPDISRCGGFTTARKVMWMAQQNSIDVVCHAWLSDLLTAASLHLNAALPRSLFVEYNVCGGNALQEIIKNPLKMKEGYIEVPEGPGLGIEVDEDVINKYRVL